MNSEANSFLPKSRNLNNNTQNILDNSNQRISGTKRSLPKNKKSFCRRVNDSLKALIEHWVFITITTTMTVFVLFADDLRQLTANPNTDSIYYILILICFGLFVAEIIVTSVVQAKYFNGFYFWLDVISTLTLLLDVGWVSEVIFGTSMASGALSSATLAKAARASKIGSRAGRIVRILRLIRLIRIVKLYKASEQLKLNERNAKIKPNLKPNDSKKQDNSNTSLSFKTKDKVSDANLEEGLMKLPKSERNKRKSMTVNQVNQISNTLLRTLTKKAENDKDNKAEPNPVLRHNASKFSIIDLLENNLMENKTELTKAVKLDGMIEQNQIEFDNASQQNKDAVLENELMEKETNVGKKLSDMTTKRVVVIVLLIMLGIPVFSSSTYLLKYSNYEFGVDSMLLQFNRGMEVNERFNEIWDYYIGMTERNGINLLNLRLFKYINDDNIEIVKEYGSFELLNGFRINELLTISKPEEFVTNEYYISVYLDNSFNENITSILSILRTFFVVIVLAGAALLFSKDATDLVLTPIEKMMRKINNITENPLNAAKIEEEETFFLDNLMKNNKAVAKEMQEQDNYETSVLEKIIVKIGGLLAIGFGEAGAEIIIQNMKTRGEIDVMIPGRKIMAVFGFCDIRNFTDATEVLREEVMVFVNEIAEIVHSIVDKYAGTANKNIGDAFLVVWKFKEENIERHENELELMKNTEVKATVDMSVFSFVQILAELYQSREMEKYKHHKKLNKRIPNYRVNMGFGLNLGWAIEGAIGSEFKIDASYLSPNVNMASRLEAATKQFGVPILISNKIYEYCSIEVKKMLRCIDCVTVKGSDEPISLYTFDSDPTVLKLYKKEKNELSGLEKKKKKFINIKKRKVFKSHVMSGKIKTIDLFKRNPHIMHMHRKYDQEFQEKWNKGYDCYISGNWPTAKLYLEETRNYIKDVEDGPSVTLLSYMENRDFQAPTEWNGVRELTEK